MVFVVGLAASLHRPRATVSLEADGATVEG